MKKFINTIQNKFLFGCLFLIFFSCKKSWNEHYVKPEYLKNGSVFELLSKNPEYSEFTDLLKKTGYDSLLMSNSTFTVFAVKNGAFAGIDTTNVTVLKKIIGMHIVNATVFSDGMNSNRVLAVSGKLLRFANTQTGQTVNTIPVTILNAKALNGVLQQVDKVILPAPSLYDIVATSPDLSFFKTFIDSSFTYVIDTEKNIRIGYDTANQPVYQQPIIYKQVSDYLTTTGIKDESVVRTVFIPANSVVNKALSNLLAARAGRTDLIIPRLPQKHNDTTIGYVFIPSWMPYTGDTAMLLDYLFKHPVIGEEIPALAAGENSFKNIGNNQFSVSSTQVQTNATYASNGIYYLLNDITLPDVIYRSRFMFLPFPKVKNPSGSTISNPNIAFSGGTNTSPSQSSNSSCYTGKYTRFNFNNVGGKVEFTFPFATKGYYKVNLKNYLDNNGCMVSASYGGQQLKQNLNTSTQYAISAVMVDVDLGTINVPADGPVKITFTCTDVSPKTASKYEFCVDLVELVPVQGP
jgi:uncharacterized surface protein with fasciclin (FAS1) repeats